MFVIGKPSQPSVMYHYNLLGSFLSNDENEVLWMDPGAELIKLFWSKITYSFCKLDLFIEMQQI